MGLFGGDSEILTTTVSNATDRRTLAEQDGIAVQSIGGDLLVTETGDAAFALAGEAIQSVLDVSQQSLGIVAGATLDSVEVLAAAKGSQPINPVLVILALGAAFWLMRGGKLI